MGVRCRLFAPLCLNTYAQRIRVSISSLTECASRRPKIQKVQIPAACIQDPTQPHHYPDRQPAYVPSALTRPRSLPGATNSALAFIPPKPKELHTTRRVAAALRRPCAAEPHVLPVFLHPMRAIEPQGSALLYIPLIYHPSVTMRAARGGYRVQV